MIVLVNDLEQSHDENSMSIFVLIDFSVAFNTINQY